MSLGLPPRLPSPAPASPGPVGAHPGQRQMAKVGPPLEHSPPPHSHTQERLRGAVHPWMQPQLESECKWALGLQTSHHAMSHIPWTEWLLHCPKYI